MAARGTYLLSIYGVGMKYTAEDWMKIIDRFAEDGMENHFWINRGDGTFREQAMVLGSAVNVHGKAEASMGVAVGDVDGDADLDLFLTHLDRETHTFYANMEGRWFEARTAGAGLGSDSLAYTGFGAEFLDADADGDLDLALVNGKVRRGAGRAPAPAARQSIPPLVGTNSMLCTVSPVGMCRSGMQLPVLGSIELSELITVSPSRRPLGARM